MSTASQRLRKLEQILATTRVPFTSADDQRDAATLHLESAALERIRQITALLERSDGVDDDADGVAMRLLLDDYASAVAHLRAVTRHASRHLDAAAEPVMDVRRFLWRDDKLRASLRAALDDTAQEE